MIRFEFCFPKCGNTVLFAVVPLGVVEAQGVVVPITVVEASGVVGSLDVVVTKVNTLYNY